MVFMRHWARRTEVAAGLIFAAPAVFATWLVWFVQTPVCKVLDVGDLSGPAVAFALAGLGVIIAAIHMLRGTTELAVAVIIVGILECVGFGMALLWSGLCIPAAP